MRNRISNLIKGLLFRELRFKLSIEKTIKGKTNQEDRLKYLSELIVGELDKTIPAKVDGSCKYFNVYWDFNHMEDREIHFGGFTEGCPNIELHTGKSNKNYKGK